MRFSDDCRGMIWYNEEVMQINDRLYEKLDMCNRVTITTVIARSIALQCDVAISW